MVFLICADETQTWKSPMGHGYTTGEMDAFRCAVAFANDPAPNPQNYRWWYFCDKREKE